MEEYIFVCVTLEECPLLIPRPSDITQRRVLPVPTVNTLSPVVLQDFRPKVRRLFTTHPTY